MKLFGTIFLALSLSACNQAAFEAYSNYPTESGAYAEEVHPCVNMDVAAIKVYELVGNVQNEYQKDAIINELQKFVKDDPSYTILQSATEYLYNQDPVPSKELFVKMVEEACRYKFGTIADRKHV